MMLQAHHKTHESRGACGRGALQEPAPTWESSWDRSGVVWLLLGVRLEVRCGGLRFGDSSAGSVLPCRFPLPLLGCKFVQTVLERRRVSPAELDHGLVAHSPLAEIAAGVQCQFATWSGVKRFGNWMITAAGEIPVSRQDHAVDPVLDCLGMDLEKIGQLAHRIPGEWLEATVCRLPAFKSDGDIHLLSPLELGSNILFLLPIREGSCKVMLISPDAGAGRTSIHSRLQSNWRSPFHGICCTLSNRLEG